MTVRRLWSVPAAMVLLAWLAGPVHAEITSIAGVTSAIVRQLESNVQTASDDADDAYPDLNESLPLQVVAHLLVEGDDPAAAAVAVQFADPLDQTGLNPEEFAVNLTLLSISDAVRFTGRGRTQETRGVVFTPHDFPNAKVGDTLPLIGHLYVDGALAIFSPRRDRDLTGAEVNLEITVVKQVEGQEDDLVFRGQVGLKGGEGGSVQRVAAGDFPTLTLIRTDLSVFVDDFDLFELLIIPRLTIAYNYPMTIGEPFKLQATVEVTGANAEDEVGVTAIIGTPVDSIQEVIAAARGDGAATKTINALTTERANPTGTLAFPEETTAKSILPVCGLFGVEFLLGIGALVGLRSYGPLRRRMLAE